MGGVVKADLPFPLGDGGRDQRHARAGADPVDQIAGVEIVGAVEDKLIVGHQRLGRLGVKAALIGAHVDKGVQGAHGDFGRLHLGQADAGVGVDDLALQVRAFDRVIVDHPDGAHPGGREI